jgi:hypothetical protein
MTEFESGTYSVVVLGADAIASTYRAGLSHEAAMRVAEDLQREGKVVRVVHDVHDGRYEVDRYPLR